MSMDLLSPTGSRRTIRPALAAFCLAAAACGGERADPADGGPPADGTSAIRPLAPPAAAGSGEPNLAVGPDGRVYLSWLEPAADSAHALRFSVLEGDAWSPPRTVASGRDWFVNWADFPSLAVLPGNRLAAHWLQRSGTSTYAYDVRVAVSPDGGATWSDPVVPHTDGTQTEHGFVSMWPAGGDSVALVWLDGRKTGASAEGEHNPASEMTLRYTTVGPDGRAAPDREVDGRVCDCCQTGMAMTSTGPIVVYRDRSPDEVRDIYVSRRVNGAWTEGRPVHADGWVMPACPVNGPQADADGQRVAVAWFTAADSTPAVKVAFSTDGGATFGAPARIDGGNPDGRVDVQLLPDGAALVSWLERTGQAAEVRIRRVGPDGRMGEPRTLAASASTRSTGFPRMVRAGDQVVFAWTGPGTPSTLHAARLALADLR